MTRTFNPEFYGHLLAKYQPKRITAEEENQQAIALVVFATWKPIIILLGAYLFGGVSAIQLIVQGLGVDIYPYLLSALPYLATIVVLVIISRDATRIQLRFTRIFG